MGEVELICFHKEKAQEYDIITVQFKVPKGFDLRSDIDVLQMFESICTFKDLSNKVREELFNKYVMGVKRNE